MLCDCYRVLKPGGLLRLVLPDCEKFVRAWREGDELFFKGSPYLTPHFASEVECLVQMGGNPQALDKPSNIGHWSFWDRYSLSWLLAVAGFRTIHDSAFGRSIDPALREIATMDHATGMPLRGFDNPLTQPISVYLEAVRTAAR